MSWSENKIGTQIWEAQPGDTLERAKLAATQHHMSLMRHAGVLYELRTQVIAEPLGRLDVIPPESSEFAVGDKVRPSFVAGHLRSQVGRVEHVDTRNVWVRWPDAERPSAHAPSQLEIVLRAHHKGEADE